MMGEKLSSLRMTAEICKRLEDGTSEQEIMDYFDVERDLLLEYIRFALDNNWITRQNGKYKVTEYGREVIPEL